MKVYKIKYLIVLFFPILITTSWCQQFAFTTAEGYGKYTGGRVCEVTTLNPTGPFNPTTTIRFDFPEKGYYSLKVYNSLGQEVAILLDCNKSAGRYSVNWMQVILHQEYIFTGYPGAILFLQEKCCG